MFALPPRPRSNNRLSVAPHLQEGQEFNYRVRYREDRTVHTESRVSSPLAPESTHIDIVRTLHVVVLQSAAAHAGGPTRLRLSLSNPDAPVTSAEPPYIEFALSPKGDVQDLNNIATFSPEEQLLWRAWLEQFTVVWSLPPNIYIGEKWSTEEPILGSVLDGLGWQKESHLVSQQTCPTPLPDSENSGTPSPLRKPEANPTQPTCVTMLTRAALKQKSSARDATPEDYKLHDLKTSGSARGADDGISYINIISGLVARSTDSSTQSMDVVVAKKDGSNRVHYTIQAESRAEIVLLP